MRSNCQGKVQISFITNLRLSNRESYSLGIGNLSGLLHRCAGVVPNFSLVSEPEMYSHRRSIEGPKVEANAVRFGEQCIDLEGPAHRVHQLRTPVRFQIRPSAQGLALAATVQGGAFVIKIDKG